MKNRASWNLLVKINTSMYCPNIYLAQPIFDDIGAVLENAAPGRLVQKLLCRRLKSAAETN